MLDAKDVFGFVVTPTPCEIVTCNLKTQGTSTDVCETTALNSEYIKITG